MPVETRGQKRKREERERQEERNREEERQENLTLAELARFLQAAKRPRLDELPAQADEPQRPEPEDEDFCLVLPEYEEGDLIWGRLGKLPYFPGVLVKDPQSGEYFKAKRCSNGVARKMYRVRWCGDAGQRWSWVGASALAPYQPHTTLKTWLQETAGRRNKKNFAAARTPKASNWQEAVEVAAGLLPLTSEERLEHLLASDAPLPADEWDQEEQPPRTPSPALQQPEAMEVDEEPEAVAEPEAEPQDAEDEELDNEVRRLGEEAAQRMERRTPSPLATPPRSPPSSPELLPWASPPRYVIKVSRRRQSLRLRLQSPPPNFSYRELSSSDSD